MNRRDRYGRAGFVLPTVTMVLLVVVLLTIAITLRSFDRAKIAQYRRVNEAVLQAATPALDRARAKLEDLLGGGNESRKTGLSSRGIPTEASLYDALTAVDTPTKEPLFTFPDEERLTVSFDLPDGNNALCDVANFNGDSDNKECESMKTAWRFPVDTDNNGEYDSLTYYGIFFRTPPVVSNQEARARVPLDARTLPVDAGTLSGSCATGGGTSASLVGETGWLKATDGVLKKSFFIYTVTVPVTQDDINSGNLTRLPGTPESFSGTPGFSALELQQDYSREPIVNNAVIYEDDLDISTFPEFNLNGRIVTNSNLIISPRDSGDDIKLYLVSAPASCFYTADNSKIQVAGNVVVGTVDDNIANSTEIHLFDPSLAAGSDLPGGKKQTLTTGNDSVSNAPTEVLYNSLAYEKRIEALVAADPSPLLDDPFTTQINDGDPNYYQKATRKVPFAEIAEADSNTATATVQNLDGKPGPDFGSMLPVNDQGNSANTSLSLEINNLPATEPDENDPNFQIAGEQAIGDRISVGNNLPLRYFFEPNAGTGAWRNTDYQMSIEGGQWTGNTPGRYRQTQVAEIPSAGETARNGDWEKDAVRDPVEPSEGVGGLLVVTGAGVYNRGLSFLPPPIPEKMQVDGIVRGIETVYQPVASGGEEFTVVWPDTMPMSPPYAYNLTASPITVSAIPGSQVYKNDDLYNADGLTPVANATFTSTIENNLNARWVTTPLTSGNDQYAKGDLRMRSTIVYHYASADEEINDTKLFVDDPAQEPNLELGDLIPIACVSSYYDPSSSFTAQNETGLPWNDSSTGRSNNGIVYPVPTSFDNPALTRQARLIYPDGRLVNEPLYRGLQKNYTGLTLEEHAAVYSAQCSLDILAGASPVNSATYNVGDPLTRTTTLYTSGIPDGAIREATLLDARQVKALDANDPATDVDETSSLRVNPDGTVPATPDLAENYRQPLEDRYPLEVRVTQLDLNALRNTTIDQTLPGEEAPTVNGTEYLLPLSGIVYASRDDALPDFSEATLDESATDFKIDPSRSPDGIMLINGERLARNDADDDGQNDIGAPSREDVIYEKGLILTSNLPVYIWGDFNLHTHEEFTDTLNGNWSNFYTRKTPDEQFACRANDPRLPNCSNDGDDWRAATVLSDAVTLLTRNDDSLKEGFRLGFRNEGDFDLRNNAGNVIIGGGYDFDDSDDLGQSVDEAAVGLDLNEDGDTADSFNETEITAKMARLLAGFNPYNDYVVSGLSSGAEFDTDNDPSTALQPYTDEAYRTTGENPANSSYFNNFVTPIQRRRTNFSEYVMEMCLKLPVSACVPDDWEVIDGTSGATKSASDAVGDNVSSILGSGTTSSPPALDYQRFPRRVAFKRDVSSNYALELDGNLPIPLGIDGSSAIADTYTGTTVPPNNTTDETLWFQTRNGTNKNWGPAHPLWYYAPDNQSTSRTSFNANALQPLLVPVLQIHAGNANNTNDNVGTFPAATQPVDRNSWWLPGVSNAVATFNLIVGTGDTPPRPGEFNGGLQNLPRFLENFRDNNDRRDTRIFGSFVQTGRSRYATAPYQSMKSDANTVHPPIFGNEDGNRVYQIGNSSGRTPFFSAPNRDWGFDVGLLSQTPDRYASKFAEADTVATDYFRELNRDDPWVETLLCSRVSNTNTPALARTGNRVQLTGTDCSNYGG